ncbi:MerR family DNA-binding transcriptional regulator [Staphylococcus pseudintermedius]|nr:MerR family DNA-binding transcriptional regulator [Staphylococcus pseudintermedius]MDE9905355.1 MerR family DNA-binding transcriptional regulator [Staphylococcus pseudintermedius]MDK3781756.1 MerR family DNA-binding transcriptional regulator [Staphylococcus pseudintermedius]MDQ7195048.1 MerR family DNA-binding transcriptional regulator [Staphylococcus pseudintermedius]
MYTIKVVSELTGLSTRTLRYYDQIGLLNPSNSSEAGYRLYNEKDIA